MKYKSTTLLALAILAGMLLSYFAGRYVPSIRMAGTENRTYATFHMVFHPEKGSVVYHESPVERLDAALSDQFPFREAVVGKYLELANMLGNATYDLAGLFADRSGQQYALHSLGSYALIENTGYITDFPRSVPIDEAVLQGRAEQLKALHRKYPKLKIYAYFVSKASDTPWFDGYLGRTSPDYFGQLARALPGFVKRSRLQYRDLDDYAGIHYKTDHHWNHRGARRGYEDVLSMMKDDFNPGEPREPVGEINASRLHGFGYLGSYGSKLGDLYKYGPDEFEFYDFALPERELHAVDPRTLEETPLVSLGLYEEYKRGEIRKSTKTEHYTVMYGSAKDGDGNEYKDNAWLFKIRNTGGGNGKNLLICSDSYGRGIRDVLASHFDTTVYLDYRLFSEVPVGRLIEKYDIDALLLLGQHVMWRFEEYWFNMEGVE
jgi:hypothetical protein